MEVTYKTTDVGNMSSDASITLPKDEHKVEELSLNIRIILAVMKCVIVVLVISMNLLTWVVIASTKKLRKPQGFFMLSMTTADFLQGVLLLPFLVKPGLILMWPYSKAMCNFTSYETALYMAVSLYSMAVLSLDRFIAIKFPFQYHNKMTKRRAIILVVLIWLVFGIGLGGPVFGWFTASYVPPSDQCLPDYIHYPFMFPVMITYLLVAYVIIVLLNLWNLWIAQRHWSHIRDLTANRDHNKKDERKKKSEMKSRLRAANTVGLMVLILVITYTPMISVLLAKFLTGIHTPKLFEIIHLWFVYANSFCNCLVYTVRTRSFRRGAVDLVRRLLCRPTVARDGPEDGSITTDATW